MYKSADQFDQEFSFILSTYQLSRRKEEGEQSGTRLWLRPEGLVRLCPVYFVAICSLDLEFGEENAVGLCVSGASQSSAVEISNPSLARFFRSLQHSEVFLIGIFEAPRFAWHTVSLQLIHFLRGLCSRSISFYHAFNREIRVFPLHASCCSAILLND